jgi:DNA polymerase III subunit gamma/tau
LNQVKGTLNQVENTSNRVEGTGFSPYINQPESTGALAPEAGSSSASINRAAASETTAVGLLELPETAEESPEAETTQETGPQIVPSLTATTASSAQNINEIRSAVAQALNSGGHATAAVLIEDGKWIIEGSSVRIEVNAKATMIRLTFNAAAEKLIRQGLSQSGAPTRFLIVPGDGLASSGTAPRIRAPLGSIENEARSHPLVAQAQSIFNAEIVTVVDLREK